VQAEADQAQRRSQLVVQPVGDAGVDVAEGDLDRLVAGARAVTDGAATESPAPSKDVF
jgi:hypothetical protein